MDIPASIKRVKYIFTKVQEQFDQDGTLPKLSALDILSLSRLTIKQWYMALDQLVLSMEVISTIFSILIEELEKTSTHKPLIDWDAQEKDAQNDDKRSTFGFIGSFFSSKKKDRSYDTIPLLELVNQIREQITNFDESKHDLKELVTLLNYVSYRFFGINQQCNTQMDITQLREEANAIFERITNTVAGDVKYLEQRMELIEGFVDRELEITARTASILQTEILLQMNFYKPEPINIGRILMDIYINLQTKVATIERVMNIPNKEGLNKQKVIIVDEKNFKRLKQRFLNAIKMIIEKKLTSFARWNDNDPTFDEIELEKKLRDYKQTSPSKEAKPLGTVTALYDFAGECEDELSFKQGDVIKVYKTSDDGWWLGSVHEGDNILLFPANYCTDLKQLEKDEKSESETKKEELKEEEEPKHQKQGSTVGWDESIITMENLGEFDELDIEMQKSFEEFEKLTSSTTTKKAEEEKKSEWSMFLEWAQEIKKDIKDQSSPNKEIHVKSSEKEPVVQTEANRESKVIEEKTVESKDTTKMEKTESEDAQPVKTKIQDHLKKPAMKQKITQVIIPKTTSLEFEEGTITPPSTPFIFTAETSDTSKEVLELNKKISESLVEQVQTESDKLESENETNEPQQTETEKSKAPKPVISLTKATEDSDWEFDDEDETYEQEHINESDTKKHETSNEEQEKKEISKEEKAEENEEQEKKKENEEQEMKEENEEQGKKEENEEITSAVDKDKVIPKEEEATKEEMIKDESSQSTKETISIPKETETVNPELTDQMESSSSESSKEQLKEKTEDEVTEKVENPDDATEKMEPTKKSTLKVPPFVMGQVFAPNLEEIKKTLGRRKQMSLPKKESNKAEEETEKNEEKIPQITEKKIPPKETSNVPLWMKELEERKKRRTTVATTNVPEKKEEKSNKPSWLLEFERKKKHVH